MQRQVTIGSIWNKVVEDVKMKVIHPTLWRTLEAAVPVIVENGWFVVGFQPGSFHMSGNLTTAHHLVAIERALLQFTGVKLKLRIIEGTSLEDWVNVKSKDAHIQKLREEALEQQEKESLSSQSWEYLLEQIPRQYATAPLRQFPQGKARYLKNILSSISAVMDQVTPPGEEPDELSERALARAIEKVAQLTDLPSSLVAVELLRMRE